MNPPTLKNPPLNYHAFDDRIATSGQPDRSQLFDIAGAGYEVLINLAMHDSDNAIPEEGSIAASLGMHYINIPVPFEEPTEEHLREFIGFMEVLADKRIWVHCAVNARVSAFMFHYLRGKGLDEETATSPVLRKWRPRMDPAWEDFMEIEL